MESRVSIVRFFFHFFLFLKFLSFPSSSFQLLLLRSLFFCILEASNPREWDRETGHAEILRRSRETFDESARHSNPQVPLILKPLSLSLSRTVKDIFVEHRLTSLSPRCFARFRDTLVEKLLVEDARRVTKGRNGKNFSLQLLLATARE